jgi:hypothetical protein
MRKLLLAIIVLFILVLIYPSSLIAKSPRSKPALDTEKESPTPPETFKPNASQRESVEALSGRRIALVIGNSTYSSGPLKNPVNDATDMAATLKKLGFTVTLRRNVRMQEMEEAIDEFGNRLKRGGVGLFYYAGHGVQVNGTNYLLPVGAKINKESDVRFQAVDAGRVLAEMENANNGLNIVILDACRDNPFGKTFRSASRGLAIVSSAPVGTFISYSTGAGQVARDGEFRNSPYTSALLQYMQEPGVPITDVFINVRQKLRKETGQVPWELSSLEGKFYFVPGSGKMAIDKSEIKEMERPSAPVQTPEPSSFDDLKRKMEERREKESQWVKDFEDAKKMEEESSGMTEKIQVWRQFIATLSDEHTAKGDEIRKYASNRIERLEQFRTMGKTPPKEIRNDGRFIAYDDGTVLDTRTGLMWAARDNEYDIDWADAKSYCKSYRGGGYMDWRMPTENELAGLYDSSKSYEYNKAHDSVHLTEFIRLSECCPWASETRGEKAARFCFFDGRRNCDYWQTSKWRVLPVRSAK